MKTFAEVLDTLNSELAGTDYLITYFPATDHVREEFVFSDIQYGMDVYSETLIVALMRMDRQEAYYAAMRAEEEAARRRELEHFSTTENGDFDYMYNL